MRVHRQSAPATCACRLNGTALGTLDKEIMSFAVPPGTHVITLGLEHGGTRSVVRRFPPGTVVDLTADVEPHARSGPYLPDRATATRRPVIRD